MDIPDSSADDPFSPLTGFCVGMPAPTALAGDQVPEPYRRLLVNQGDMTPTLEAFHGCRLGLRLLAVAAHSDGYRRHVLLVKPDGTPVEYGAIRIHLATLPPAARDQVQEARRPLGGVLIDHAVPHRSQPSAFFSLPGTGAIAEALDLVDTPILYGRCNTLIGDDGRCIATVVEILPPVAEGSGVSG